MNRAAIHPRSARAFTLLEAVLALAILAAVVAACMQIRGQMLDVSARASRQQRADRSADALFQCVVSGLLGQPTSDAQSGIWTWEGKQDGVAYRIERTGAVTDNPAAGRIDYKVAPRIQLYRYTITLGSTKTEFLWHK